MSGVILRPFRGYLPSLEDCSSIISPAYDVIDRASARELSDSNPNSIIRVLHPEAGMPSEISSTDPSSFQLGKENLQEFISRDILRRHSAPAYYVYRQQLGTHVQRGVFGLASCEQYLAGLIKKHEHTRSASEEAGSKTLKALNANLSSVFLAFKSSESPSLLHAIANVMAAPPDRIAHLSTDNSKHELWIVDYPNPISELVAKLSAVYIADGHHRSACAARFYAEKKREAGGNLPDDDPAAFFLACLFADSELRILDFNRVVTGVKESSEVVLQAIAGQGFEIRESVIGPIGELREKRLHRFDIFFRETWYTATFCGELKSKSPASAIDAQILMDFVFQPVFGITDLKTAGNVRFVAGPKGLKKLEEVAKQEEGIAFALAPVRMAELFAVADEGEIMPPKSTCFLPKLPTGLVVRLIERDEE